MLPYNQIPRIEVVYPSFIMECIFSLRSLLFILILCYLIFLFCIFLYSLIISYIDPAVDTTVSDGGTIGNLCIHLHYVINNLVVNKISEKINDIKTNNNSVVLRETANIIGQIWENLSFILIPHVSMKKYDIDNANDNKYVFLYMMVIIAPIVGIVVNPIRMSTSVVINRWVAQSIYVGDFRSIDSARLYSIVNDRLQHSLPSLIRSFFLITSAIIFLYILSGSILTSIQSYVKKGASHIRQYREAAEHAINNNDTFLLKMRDKIGNRIVRHDLKGNFEKTDLTSFCTLAYEQLKNPNSLAEMGQERLEEVLMGYANDFQLKLFFVALFT